MNFFGLEAYTFWLIGWLFVASVWVDLITGSNFSIILKKAPIIISIGGGILFIVFETLVIILVLQIINRNITILIINILLAISLTSGCILIPIYGSKLLARLNKFGNPKTVSKLKKKTKIMILSAIFFGIILVVLVIFVVVDNLFNLTPVATLSFQLVFRVGEIIIVPILFVLVTGHSIKTTFLICVGKKKKSSTAKTEQIES